MNSSQKIDLLTIIMGIGVVIIIISGFLPNTYHLKLIVGLLGVFVFQIPITTFIILCIRSYKRGMKNV